MQQVEPTAEQRVTLDGISWETYERLLAESNPGRGKRFTYDAGTLEIMVLSRDHEEPSWLLGLIVEVLAEELDIDIVGVGSTTYKRSDLNKGFEPDAAFYIGSAAALRGKHDVDTTVHPPPDLVIEVDITSPSIQKLPIFAAMGIREVWRYVDGRVTIHALRDGRYIVVENSTVLAPLSAGMITMFVQAGKTEPRPKWFKSIRDWVRKNM